VISRNTEGAEGYRPLSQTEQTSLAQTTQDSAWNNESYNCYLAERCEFLAEDFLRPSIKANPSSAAAEANDLDVALPDDEILQPPPLSSLFSMSGFEVFAGLFELLLFGVLVLPPAALLDELALLFPPAALLDELALLFPPTLVELLLLEELPPIPD
jgi:hypothetical protein